MILILTSAGYILGPAVSQLIEKADDLFTAFQLVKNIQICVIKCDI